MGQTFDQMKMLNQLRKAQKELKNEIVEVEAGDGAVVVQINGELKVKKVTIDPENGILDVKYDKLVVEEVFDPESEISIEEARKINPDAQEGDELMVSAPVDQLRKTTVLSVKSILKQKFTEAEKEVLYENFKDKINTIITGRVEKADERGLTVNIGKTSVFLPKNYMLRDEKYYVGDVIKLYVKDVASGSKGAHINVSRTDAGFLRCLLEEIITEIYEGTSEVQRMVIAANLYK